MNLAKTQLFSLATKAVTVALGIVQSIIVIRLLGPANFGLAGLVMSVGSVVGVAQHLGIVDGAIREIAVLKNRAAAGKVFWVSHLVRQAVTLPLTVILMALAGLITARIYGRPELAAYLMIFAGSLVLQGLQDVLGATLTGLKRFVGLYAVQIITATLNIFIFGLLTWRFGLAGFFWAIIITTSVMVVLLAALVAKHLAGSLQLPSMDDLRRYARRVMRIGAYMYVARIFFVVWQRLPLLVLGAVLSADQLGYLNVSQTFGSRLTIIAMALSEVNLAWMSSLFVSERAEFIRAVTRNMQRVLVLMTALTLVLLFFTPEILRYLIGGDFLPAHDIVLVVTAAFYLYALMDIGTSSVFVAADKPRTRALLYGVMTGVTLLLLTWLLISRPDPFLAGLAVLTGAVISYAAMVLLARKYFNVSLLTDRLAVLLVLLGASVWWLMGEVPLIQRSAVFALLLLYLAYAARRSNLLPRWRPAGPVAIDSFGVICFAGSPLRQPSWTNRQQIMTRVAKHHRTLYVEPRVWILRFLVRHWRQPREVLSFLQRVLWYEKYEDNLYVKAQWNLLPGSREYRTIASLNHWLNRWWVVLTARYLGLTLGGKREGAGRLVMWVYDTEAAEYLSAFPGARVLYDCVDDHAAQAGVNRNPQRVQEEEAAIMARADLVTVTSRRLFELKRGKARRVELVLNAGDTLAFTDTAAQEPSDLVSIRHPRLGTVGALDRYKIDFVLLAAAAKEHPRWQFIFIGAPIVTQKNKELADLAALPNVHVLGPRRREIVPPYVHHFDVCLIPYRSSRYNQASFPLKFWEFMATGKPIVATGVPELREYRDYIGYAEDMGSFIAAIEQSLRPDDAGAAGRRQLAADHSWDHRAFQLLRLLRDIV